MPEQTNPIAKQLAEQLRDVQLPESVGWWPLAAGWWVVLFLILVAIIVLSVAQIKRWRSNRYRKDAQSQLDDAHALWQKERSTSLYLQTANEIFKRAMLNLDNSSAISLSGRDWVDSLNQMVKHPLSDVSQNALANECYKANPKVDVDAIHADLIRWIKAHRINNGESSNTSEADKMTQVSLQQAEPHA